MDEIDKTNLTDQTKNRLNKITKVEKYFIKEIYQRKLCSKKLSKHVSAFDYIDIVLNATSGAVSFILFTSVVGPPVGVASASFTLFFSLTTGIIKKLLSITRNKNKKHDKIFMLAKSKLNSIETLVSQTLIDMEISHEEFIAIFEKKDKYEKIKENVRNVREKSKETNEIMRLNSVNSGTEKSG